MCTRILSSKKLGVNCWLAVRLLGGKCDRVKRCKYPEKKRCKARR